MQLRRMMVGLIHRLVSVVILVLVASISGFGQTSNEKLEGALEEITLLKHVIAEQDRRISALENTLKSLQVTSSQAAPTIAPSSGRQSVGAYVSTYSWKTSTSWDAITKGMSQSQVVAILGKPTSTKDVGPFRTLYYQGEVAGSGVVSGNVQLTDDRVWMINEPVF